MPSFRTAVFAIAAAFITTATADYPIDPTKVRESDRKKWCLDQTSVCPLICKQTSPPTTLVNTCNWETLQYGCICGNQLAPNVSEYSLTIPFYVCQEWGNQCVKNCGLANNACAQACREDHPCGAQNPSGPNATVAAAEAADAASTSGKPSTTSAAPGTIFSNKAGEGGGQTAGTSGWENERGRIFGMLGLLAGMAMGFGML